MNDGELHLLSGAYAVNALTPDERIRFKRHLKSCDECAIETRELLETAGEIGAGLAVVVRPGLLEDLMAQLPHERQVPPTVTLASHHDTSIDLADEPSTTRSSFGSTRLVATLMAAAASAAIFGGVAVGVASHERSHVDAMETQVEHVADVVTARDAVVVPAVVRGGGNASLVLSHSQNAGVVMTHGLPAATGNRHYRLWAISSDGVAHAAGVVEPDSSGAGSAPLNADMTTVVRVAMTLEPMNSADPSAQHVFMVDLPPASTA